ncbi:TPA: hypothetical protein ACHKUK_001818, partial [Escherichia coli]
MSKINYQALLLQALALKEGEMTTISRERIEQYANDPRMCNVNDEIRQIARIALASLEAEPVAYIFKHPAG